MPKHAELPTAFAELGLQTSVLVALDKTGFNEPTEIQSRLIPLVLEGKDVLGQARTGTGKTAAFGLPIMQMIDRDKRMQALVLVPTRELAVQVTAELRRFAGESDLHIVPVYGGQRIKHQLHLLGKKPHLVVGTPGRVIDLLDRRALHLDELRFAVLDEVDRMLDIGFRDDIHNILSRIQRKHQTVFVSATLTDEIKRLARKYMDDPVEVNVSADKLTVDDVRQSYISVDPWDKFRLLKLFIEKYNPRLAIVFCNTKHAARKLAKRLHAIGVNAREIHGDLVQQKREKVMERFRRHKLQVLVATDLAARGIDVSGISHIINYDIPEDPHIYVHRIGRTARMGTFGEAITLVTREEGKQLTEVEKLINLQVAKLEVEGFEPRPEPEDFRRDVPRGRGGRPWTPAAIPKPAVVAQTTEEPAKPKSLGGRFKPARRRRR